MGRTSFLVRCWHHEGEQRIEIERIQSGERILVPSLAAALAWMEEQFQPGAALPGSTEPPALGELSP